MTPWRVLMATSTGLELALFVVLIRSHAFRICRTFPLYVLAVVLPDAVFLAAPATFTWNAWVAKETLQAAIKLGLVLELVTKIFAGLPRARRLADSLLLWLLVGAQVLLLWLRIGPDAAAIAQRALPVVNDATAIAFSIVFGLAAFYRVPLHPLHRAILAGLAPFLLVFTLGFHGLEALGWDPHVGNAVAIAYDALLLYWIVVAIRERESIPASPAIVRELRPWA